MGCVAVRCPYCGQPDTKVIDSRAADAAIRRRRQCPACGQRFTTYERIAAPVLYIIKKDGRREEYQREKLLAGIRKACEKRPLPTGAIEHMVDEIEAELHALGQPEVPSRTVGEMVMQRLRELDHIAYIRFASVYRQFGDIEDLLQAIQALRDATVPPGQLTLLPEERPEARPRLRTVQGGARRPTAR